MSIPSFGGGVYFKHDFNSSILNKVFINFELYDVYNDYFRVSDDDPFHENDTYSFVLWDKYDDFRFSFFSNLIKDYIYGKNMIKKIDTISSSKKNYIANVSYIYNYADSPNDGYYWVDNYDNSLIEYIPPIPKRDGYLFGGWYKEEECINKWDFNNDKTGSSYVYYSEPGDNSTEEYKEFYYDYISNHTYVETKLFAKWIKN